MELKNLPEETILQNILPRLSLESLRQCRLVSKTWYSFISDPFFEKLFKAINPTHRHLLFVCLDLRASVEGSPPQIFIAPVSEHQSGLQFANPTHVLTIPNLKCSEIDVQTVNGFLCFHPRNIRCIKNSNIPTIVVNPITRQRITVPKDTSSRIDKYWVATHFGFDPFQNEFKVLQLLKFKASYEFRIWTVGTKSWRQIGIEPLSSSKLKFYERSLSCRGLCINGTIYWSFKRQVIVMFNVRYERFSFIPFPSEYSDGDLEGEPVNDSLFVEVDGHLAVVGYKWSALDLWILKENHTSHSWSKETITLPYVIESFDLILCPVCGINKGEILLRPYYLYKRRFRGYCYDMKKKLLKRTAIELPELVWPYLRTGQIDMFFYQENFKFLKKHNLELNLK